MLVTSFCFLLLSNLKRLSHCQAAERANACFSVAFKFFRLYSKHAKSNSENTSTRIHADHANTNRVTSAHAYVCGARHEVCHTGLGSGRVGFWIGLAWYRMK